jgi:hypothetical protein
MRLCYIAVLLLVLSCSTEERGGSSSVISKDDLKSEIKTALSYHRTANLLIAQHAQNATTSTFDSVELHYLADQLSSEASSLAKQKATDELRTGYVLCLVALKDLSTLAGALSEHPNDVSMRDSVARLTARTVPLLTAADSSL